MNFWRRPDRGAGGAAAQMGPRANPGQNRPHAKMDLWRVAGDADRHDRLRGSTIGAWAAALAVGLAAVLGPALPLADAASFRIAALIPDQNPFYDAYYEIINMTIQEEQAEGILAAHDVALDYTLYEFDQGYLLSDVDTFSNGSVVGFIGPMWSNDTQLAVEQAYNYSIPFCDGGATAIPLTTYPNFFRTIPSDTISARAILAMIQSKGWSSAVLMTTTDAYGAQMADAYKQAQNDFGVKIVGPFFYEPVSPYDMVEALTPEQAATYGCKKVLNAVKSTGVGIIIFPVDAYQMSNCFEYADEAGMLTRDFVYFTHDAGTEYMYRFAENDTAHWANSMIMAYPKDQIPGTGLEEFKAQWAAFSDSQFPQLNIYRTDNIIPPYLTYVRDCVRMLMRGYQRVVGDDEAKAEDLAAGINGKLLKTLTAASFDFPDVNSATGPLTIKADNRQRDYDFFYAWQGKWVPFAVWKGGNSIQQSADNLYRDGSSSTPGGGGGLGGGSSKGLSPLGIGLIVTAILAVVFLGGLGFYFYRHRKLAREQKALLDARQLLVTWSSSTHNTQLVRQLTTNGGKPNDEDSNGSMSSSETGTPVAGENPNTALPPQKLAEMMQAAGLSNEATSVLTLSSQRNAPPAYLSGVNEPPRARTLPRVMTTTRADPSLSPSASSTGSKKKKKKRSEAVDAVTPMTAATPTTMATPTTPVTGNTATEKLSHMIDALWHEIGDSIGHVTHTDTKHDSLTDNAAVQTIVEVPPTQEVAAVSTAPVGTDPVSNNNAGSPSSNS